MAIKKALVIYSGSIEELRDGDSLGASGDVTGPSSSTDNAIARFDGTTGKLIQNSTVTLDDTGNLGSVNSVGLDTTPTTPPTAVGAMFWDEGNKTPSINLENDVVLQLGQEIVALCYNGTGSTIANGAVVAVSGAQGQRPSIVLADADTEPLSAKTLGIATQAIADGQEGFITTFGFVRGIDTSAFTAGSPIYLSQTAGQFTQTRPSAPAHTVALGYVIKVNSSSGEVFVNINNGWELDELHDVLVTSPADGQILLRDQTAGVWKNITINGTTNEVTVTSTKDGITISLPDTISASITGNAGTVTNGVYTTDTGTVTNTMLAGSIANNKLTNSSITINGTAVSLGGSISVGTVTSVGITLPTGLSVSGTPITGSGTFAITYSAGYAIPTTAKQTEWDSAYTQRLQWDGGSTNLVAATGRTSLGATTLGSNLFTITNPSAITFPRFNADNTVSALSAADFRTAIGAGTGNGTVTSVGGGNGLTGSVTTSGDLALGTPSTLTTSTTNNVTADSHTHQVTFPVTSVNGQTGDVTLTTGGFASGTVMLFVQTSAPTGWTKSTTHDNKALRIVSGTASSGGSVAFTTAFASKNVSGTISNTFAVDAMTLATTQIPSHTHVETGSGPGTTANRVQQASGSSTSTTTTNSTLGAGGGSSHTHTLSGSATFSGTAINLAVSYVDAIIATKD